MSELAVIESLEIPKSHAEFAKKVADLADKYGMDRFEMTYRPNFEERFSEGYDRRLRGDMKIHYTSVDGRGRPCRSLSVHCEAAFVLSVECKPEPQFKACSE